MIPDVPSLHLQARSDEDAKLVFYDLCEENDEKYPRTQIRARRGRMYALMLGYGSTGDGRRIGTQAKALSRLFYRQEGIGTYLCRSGIGPGLTMSRSGTHAFWATTYRPHD